MSRRRLRAPALVALVLAALAVTAVSVRLIAHAPGDAVAGDGAAAGGAGGPERSAPNAAQGSPAPPPVSGSTAQSSTAQQEVTIVAVGDIVMGTPDRGLPPDGGRRFFAGVSKWLAGDVVLGNLEGTLSTGGSSKCRADSSNCFAFQTPPRYVRWLKRAGFTIVNLANNHAYDFGEEGLRETVRTLRRAGLPHTGLPGQITLQRAGDVTVAVVGFSTYPWATDMLDVEGAVTLVRSAAAQADLVVVTMHGGAEGSDAQHQPDGPEVFLGERRGDLVRFAHAVVDAGADLIAGHGPHVLRGMEWYRGRLIAYSLGNFAGYRVFSLNGPTAISGILRVTLRADGSYAAGRLIATELAGPGIPELDARELAHGVVRELSREDFGRRGARISPTGWITAPRA